MSGSEKTVLKESNHREKGYFRRENHTSPEYDEEAIEEKSDPRGSHSRWGSGAVDRTTADGSEKEAQGKKMPQVNSFKGRNGLVFAK